MIITYIGLYQTTVDLESCTLYIYQNTSYNNFQTKNEHYKTTNYTSEVHKINQES